MDALADFSPVRLSHVLMRMEAILIRLRGDELTPQELGRVRSLWLRCDALIEAQQAASERARARGAGHHREPRSHERARARLRTRVAPCVGSSRSGERIQRGAAMIQPSRGHTRYDARLYELLAFLDGVDPRACTRVMRACCGLSRPSVASWPTTGSTRLRLYGEARLEADLIRRAEIAPPPGREPALLPDDSKVMGPDGTYRIDKQTQKSQDSASRFSGRPCEF